MLSDGFLKPYRRVLPRDLFNEADLLKCLGRLWILLDEKGIAKAGYREESADGFDIVQNEATGGIVARAVTFQIDGVVHRLERPLNSREPWPLLVSEKEDDEDFDPIRVFDDDGNLSEEMLILVADPSHFP